MAKINPGQFVREVRQEVSKVTWPTRKETAITTGMVFLMVVLAAPVPPPSPPRLPTDIGGCCWGDGHTDATSTRGDCADRAQSPTGRPGMFVPGVFLVTVEVNAFCLALPGGV